MYRLRPRKSLNALRSPLFHYRWTRCLCVVVWSHRYASMGFICDVVGQKLAQVPSFGRTACCQLDFGNIKRQFCRPCLSFRRRLSGSFTDPADTFLAMFFFPFDKSRNPNNVTPCECVCLSVCNMRSDLRNDRRHGAETDKREYIPPRSR